MTTSYTSAPLRRFLLDLTDGPFGSKLTGSHYSDAGARVIRLGNIGEARFKPNDEAYIPMEHFEELRHHSVMPGDLLIAGLGDQGNPLGRACLAPEGLGPAIVKADCYRARLDESQLLHRFAAWALNSRSAAQQVSTLSRGSTRARINLDVAKAIELPVPPLEGQRAIADYLDRETARIDLLIDEQLRLTEMLRERRKAVVEQATFSGISGAPTGDNVEPWLPATPSHWPIAQLGFTSETLAGYAFPSDGFSLDEDYVRLLRGVNVKPGVISWTDCVYWNVEEVPIPDEFVLEAGDLVLGMDRPFVGGGVRIATVSHDDLPALLVQRVLRIRPNVDYEQRYASYVITTDSFLNYLEPLFTGVSVPHVSEWQVRKYKMPFPPADEQRSIATHLDERTGKIEVLIVETERFIELARERRAALITAAVTGQIDVREMT